ncbi:hypothetical protein D1BOALGB6SA_2878 [Olavius sp. associated proteobacterium Delta 1]|nr:hypothetical protein D1BOALGB6SA_2878 [Olavius sp. associated proteobacterium Delta 1]
MNIDSPETVDHSKQRVQRQFEFRTTIPSHMHRWGRYFDRAKMQKNLITEGIA